MTDRMSMLETELVQAKLENSKMKDINKNLLEQLSFRAVGVSEQDKHQHLAPDKLDGFSNIHSLYQDLYLTDLKNDLDDVESEL